jgi:hypothetical protein
MWDWVLWSAIFKGLAFLALLLCIGALFSALLGSWRRQTREAALHRVTMEEFKARLATAYVEKVAREKESLTWNGYRKFQVRRRVDEGAGISSFYLEPHDGKPIPSFRPGQYLTFSLPIPGEPRKLVRCYSLSDSPKEDYYRVSIKKQPAPSDRPEIAPGRSSSFFHEYVAEGTLLDVAAPRGDFALDLTNSNPIVLIGSGVGVTPVLSMLEAVAERGFDREVWFFYGVRSPEERILSGRISELASSAIGKLHLYTCYSQIGHAQLPTSFPIHSHAGYPDVALFKQVLPSNNFDYFVCGPPAMMEALTHDLNEWGVPDERVHYEAFGPASVKKSVRAEGIESSVAQEVEVTFKRSGKVLSWRPGDGSILELAEDNGVAIDFACRAGSCGSCLTAVRSGDVEYLDDPSANPDGGSCLPCIAVPKSTLVLDA